MAITFFINTLVVVLNVYFKYLETNDQREKADRLEAPLTTSTPSPTWFRLALPRCCFYKWRFLSTIANHHQIPGSRR